MLFCPYSKSNRKSWKIFKQVVGRGGREEIHMIRLAFLKDYTPQCEKATVCGEEKLGTMECLGIKRRLVRKLL